MLILKVIDKDNQVKAMSSGEAETNLAVSCAYLEGDKILVETTESPCWLWLQLDDALGKSLVYLTGNYEYTIPFGEKRVCYSPKVFSGERHLLSAKKAKDFEIVETRGESVFAAMNAIDGVTENRSHGEWPYASWGINRQDDAKIRLDFGRPVEVDTIMLYTRADFPHDNWWVDGRITFSDGSQMQLPMEKSVLPHTFTFDKKTITWLEMGDLIKADDPSPFPALTQIEVYGKEQGVEER